MSNPDVSLSKRQNPTLIKVISRPQSRASDLKWLKEKGAGWKIKGVDTKIGCLLCMLLAVMHQSISQPYYYSDCTQHTHTIQMRGEGVQDGEGCSGDMSDLFNRHRTL